MNGHWVLATTKPNNNSIDGAFLDEGAKGYGLYLAFAGKLQYLCASGTLNLAGAVVLTKLLIEPVIGTHRFRRSIAVTSARNAILDLWHRLLIDFVYQHHAATIDADEMYRCGLAE